MLNLNQFMNNGIKDAAAVVGNFYLGNRRGQASVLQTVSAFRKAAKRRERYEKQGTHIPPYLIASISTSCNLRCAGCYSRANGGCGDQPAQPEMTPTHWRSVFEQAQEAGVSVIMLAGGEPLLRRDIIDLATEFDSMVFLILTNGTVIDENYLALFDTHRHLIPILSIEGDDAQTDARRGEGTAARVWHAADRLKAHGILFGTSITVTSKNMLAVSEPGYAQTAGRRGCGLMFFIEYVPAEEGTEHLMLSDEDLRVLATRIESLRADKASKGMCFISFPGDEEMMGGCLAAGRGFFHINAGGGAEPCPFSPYSEMNLREHSLLEVLRSPFFEQVRALGAAQAQNHRGGCTLFMHKDAVEGIIAR